MRTSRVVPTIGVMVVLAVALVGCKKVDVVNSIQPVSTELAGIRPTLDELAKLPPEQRTARLQRDWPHLSEEVAYYARQHNLILASAEVERVEFLFGSLDRVRAYGPMTADGAGAGHEGYFRNQLVARLHVRGQSNPVDLIVLCLNGMFADPKEMSKLQNLGSAVPAQRFTIGPREGLVHHVDYPLAIDLAERFHLPLYAGRAMVEEDRITPDQARRMEPNTARVQVTVRVFEGDEFDLVAGTYERAPKKIVPPRKAHRSGKSSGATRNQRLGGGALMAITFGAGHPGRPQQERGRLVFYYLNYYVINYVIVKKKGIFRFAEDAFLCLWFWINLWFQKLY